MSETSFEGRQAVSIENNLLRVTVLREGGHIAEVFDKQAGVSPLWIPPWRSIEPSSYDPARHPEFGTGADARLLAGIMGHNLCLDLFGGPSPEEAAAGMTAHGESSVSQYEIVETHDSLVMRSTFPLAQIAFTRRLHLHGRNVHVQETVENLAAFDRPLAWTQHVTLGPPFLDPANTQFRASMTRSIVSEGDPGNDAYLASGKEFAWPMAPHRDGSVADLRQMRATAPASGYTAHLADLQREHAFWVAFSPQYHLSFGYVWRRADFPWIGVWEENGSRPYAPWSSQTLTRGMEFGASPFPESRREMVDRGHLFGVPAYRWLPSHGRLEASYWIVSQSTEAIPELLSWPE